MLHLRGVDRLNSCLQLLDILSKSVAAEVLWWCIVTCVAVFLVQSFMLFIADAGHRVVSSFRQRSMVALI